MTNEIKVHNVVSNSCLDNYSNNKNKHNVNRDVFHEKGDAFAEALASALCKPNNREN